MSALRKRFRDGDPMSAALMNDEDPEEAEDQQPFEIGNAEDDSRELSALEVAGNGSSSSASASDPAPANQTLHPLSSRRSSRKNDMQPMPVHVDGPAEDGCGCCVRPLRSVRWAIDDVDRRRVRIARAVHFGVLVVTVVVMTSLWWAAGQNELGFVGLIPTRDGADVKQAPVNLVLVVYLATIFKLAWAIPLFFCRYGVYQRCIEYGANWHHWVERAALSIAYNLIALLLLHQADLFRAVLLTAVCWWYCRESHEMEKEVAAMRRNIVVELLKLAAFVIFIVFGYILALYYYHNPPPELGPSQDPTSTLVAMGSYVVFMFAELVVNELYIHGAINYAVAEILYTFIDACVVLCMGLGVYLLTLSQ